MYESFESVLLVYGVIKMTKNGSGYLNFHIKYKGFFYKFLYLIIVFFPLNLSYGQSSSNDDEFTMALTGDSLIQRKISVFSEPSYMQMIGLIRSSDMAFTNFEMLLHDYESHAIHETSFPMRADPEIARELSWAGFDMVSLANNHTGDYGANGIKQTMRYIRVAGLVHAGVGKSLGEARSA